MNKRELVERLEEANLLIEEAACVVDHFTGGPIHCREDVIVETKARLSAWVEREFVELSEEGRES